MSTSQKVFAGHSARNSGMSASQKVFAGHSARNSGMSASQKVLASQLRKKPWNECLAKGDLSIIFIFGTSSK
ncbi:hypothetical protein [Cytobacillus kochii]|nr:hypothetical protein [Cytobacillus kochii]